MTPIATEVAEAAECCPPLTSIEMTSGEAEATASLFKALGDPTRVRIVNLLATRKQAICVCELNEQIELSQPTLSFHLKKLLSAGLIRRQQHGTWAYYSLNEGAMRRLARVVKPKGGGR